MMAKNKKSPPKNFAKKDSHPQGKPQDSRTTDRALAETPENQAGPWADTPGTEDDGGESMLAGRSREHHPAVPEQVELPPENRELPSSPSPQRPTSEPPSDA
jgi:hypothetical protein